MSETETFLCLHPALNTFFMIFIFGPYCFCPNGLVTSNMAPAHPHATSVAGYLALFFLILNIFLLFSFILFWHHFFIVYRERIIEIILKDIEIYHKKILYCHFLFWYFSDIKKKGYQKKSKMLLLGIFILRFSKLIIINCVKR